jgi:L-ectoine synthase
MIVTNLKSAEENGRKIVSDGWASVRLLLQQEGMGFSFHITTIFAGADLKMHYKNHLESVYCISGEGTIEDLATGEVHEIKPGTVYALNSHDKHCLRATSEMTMACVFNPPVTGNEVHDKSGAYPSATSS